MYQQRIQNKNKKIIDKNHTYKTVLHFHQLSKIEMNNFLY